MRRPAEKPFRDPEPAPRRRRALTHAGGAVEVESGDPRIALVLRGALEVKSSEDRVLLHVHGFHSYPARMHPDTARALVVGLSAPGETVLDPFCGSGTVLVEARAAKRVAVGSDLNPVAAELARLKTREVDAAFLRALIGAAEDVTLHARARQKAELGPTRPYGAEDRSLFATYVLLELDGLRDGIDQVEDVRIEAALRLVHSALLTKFSNRPGDSAERERPKRIPRGFALRFFEQKTRELAARLEAYAKEVPDGARAARVEIADARHLNFVRDGSVALIVSSPPYPGVYDYFEHHRVRLRWLRLDGRGLERSELASRRASRRNTAPSGWQTDFSSCFREMRRVLRRGGLAALIAGDSVEARRLVRADEWLPRLCRQAGLVVVGHASQRRPHFHEPEGEERERAPRREHLFVLRRE